MIADTGHRHNKMHDNFVGAGNLSATYSYVVGVLTLLFGWLTINNVAAIVGMFGVIFTVLLTWYFRKKSASLEREKFEFLKKLELEKLELEKMRQRK